MHGWKERLTKYELLISHKCIRGVHNGVDHYVRNIKY